MLKKIFVAALIFFAFQAQVSANNIVNFVNETHKNITEIYIAPMETQAWILHSVNFLRDGDSTKIYIDWSKFPPQKILRYFDIGVNYDDFTQEIWHGLDLSNYEEVHLKRDEFSTVFKN